MGKNKGFLTAIRYGEILMTDLGSRIPAFRFRNDRLHCPDDRLRYRELPSSPYMKTVVMAMKTVVRRKNRAPHEKEPSQDLILGSAKIV